MIRSELVVRHPIGSSLRRRRATWSVFAIFGGAFGVAALIGQIDERRCGCHGFTESKVDIAKLQVSEYASSAFRMWVRNHPDQDCPVGLGDLNQYTNRAGSNTTDVWGHEMIIVECGGRVPGHIRVMSSGEDGRPNTADDIKSWE